MPPDAPRRSASEPPRQVPGRPQPADPASGATSADAARPYARTNTRRPGSGKNAPSGGGGFLSRIPFAVRTAVVVVLSVLIVFAVVKVVMGHSTPAGTQVTVEIPKGASTKSIAKTLADAGVVESSGRFVDYVTSSSLTNSLKPGTYTMKTGMTNEDAAKQLAAGPGVTGNALVIREGLTIDETAEKVHEVCPQISVDDYKNLAYNGASTYAADYPFLQGAYANSLEGYLFPKTYDVPTDATADTVIRMQLEQFKTETAGIDYSYAAGKGLTQAQVVTMASIIEAEAYTDSDRPKIASVIYNRLAVPMRLQLDSTVIYALHGAAGEHLSTEDTQVASPYNTYVNDGLPPGPICNPGLASIKGAAQPEETTYLYYVLTSKDGTQTFCTTYDEFLAAKETYKQVFGVQ